MIEKLDIGNFGSFAEFQWDSEVRENHGAVGRFKKLNIIYGRNYSGKTTLSRIFRSYEVGQTPARFENPKFKIKTSVGLWTQEKLTVEGPPIRVYNKDFVESNLAFLRDEDGHITPFAILGAENKEVELQIEEVHTKLGSKESNTGLRAAYAKKKDEVAKAKSLVNEKTEALNKKLVDKANSKPKGIKHNPLYNNPYYDVRNLNTDISTATAQNITPLEDIARLDKVKRLTENAIPEIRGSFEFHPAIENLWQKTREITSEKIKPSAPLQDLLNSAVLTQWVKAGKALHADRDTCAFCRQPLPSDLWEALNKHFNEESETLQRKIEDISSQIEAERTKLSRLRLPSQTQFYSVFHEKHDELAQRLDAALLEYEAALEVVTQAIRERSENIFVDKQLDEATFECAAKLEEVLEEANLLVQSSNAHTAQLGATYKALREELRLSEVAAFILDSGLEAATGEIDSHKEREKNLVAELQAVEAEGKALSAKLEALQAQLKDEKRGAEQVNRYLGHSLGGTNLRLVAEEQEGQTTYRFRIMRGEQAAYNLSEGECSLVSFCYFLARLEDIQTKGTNPIIYIDDPISSLDSNHIFFIYSLIETFIAKPLRGSDGRDLKDATGKKLFKYEQLFISTHNLDFLKYLKKLSKPEQVEKFMIVRKAASSSIELMPKYLRSYITELNYLFGEIHTCVDEAKSSTSYHSFYNFGNNLRKFLEAFLFFRYPSADVNNDGRLRLFFGDADSSMDFVNRLTNEHSHLEEFVDRGMVPIDCAEISRMASFVLEAMRQKDPVQYEHFLKSVGAVDPLPLPVVQA
jgi:wobble nucleotide-excising tRNase